MAVANKDKEKYEGLFASYVDYVVACWLAYIADPSLDNLEVFRTSQSMLYLTQVYGLEENYTAAIHLLHLPRYGSTYPVY